MGARITISRLGRHFSGRETVRAVLGRTVADNTLTIKQKSTLPVSKTRQDKSLFRSLSDIYLPPTNSTAVPHVGRGSIGLLSNNAPVRPAVDEYWRVRASDFCPGKGAFRRPKGSGTHFVRRNAVTPDIFAMYRWRHFLAESAARALPFPTSQRPTCPFSFAPGGTPPARPSAASVAAVYEPFPTNRLTPASRDSGS